MDSQDKKSTRLHVNLIAQADGIRRHINIGAFPTRTRYYSAIVSFCKYVAQEHCLERLVDVDKTHIEGYAQHMIDQGMSSSTIKTNLSGVRFYLDLMPARMGMPALPTNDQLKPLKNLPKRAFVGVDRTWSPEEFKAMVRKAAELRRLKIAQAIGIMYAMGLRIHEVLQLDTNRIRRALDEGELHVKGKGGLWRVVPLEPLARKILESALNGAQPGRRVFIEPNKNVHKQMESIQHFIREHRGKIEIDTRVLERRDARYLREMGEHGYLPHITAHGLRHSYARRKYFEFIKAGYTPENARLQVSRLLGHGRDSVTRIYLGSRNNEPRN